MRIEDVKVGMRLVSKQAGALTPVTVTALTEKGFEYCLDKEMPFIPREGQWLAKDGHECYAINGKVSYEVEQPLQTE